MNTSILRMKNLNRQEMEISFNKTDEDESWVYEMTNQSCHEKSFDITVKSRKTSFLSENTNRESKDELKKSVKDCGKMQSVIEEKKQEKYTKSDFKSTNIANITSSESEIMDKKAEVKKSKQKLDEKQFLTPNPLLSKRFFPPSKPNYSKLKSRKNPELNESRIYGFPMFAAADQNNKEFYRSTQNNEEVNSRSLQKKVKEINTNGSSKSNSTFQKFKDLLENELNISSIHGDGEEMIKKTKPGRRQNNKVREKKTEKQIEVKNTMEVFFRVQIQNL